MSDSPRTAYQRVILCILAAMAIGFGILTAVNQGRPGILFEGNFLRLTREGDKALYSGKVRGDGVTISVYPDGENTVVEFAREDGFLIPCRVEYPEETLTTERGEIPQIWIFRDKPRIFRGGYDPVEKKLLEKDGSPYSVPHPSGHPTRSDPWRGFTLDELTIFRLATGPVLSYRSSWTFYYVALFLTGLCIVSVAFPVSLYRLRRRRTEEKPEPPAFYLASKKVTWAVMPVVLLLFYIYAAILIQ